MSKTTQLRAGDRVRVKQQTGLGPTIYQVNEVDGFRCWIAELMNDGTCYASQESDTSLLQKIN